MISKSLSIFNMQSLKPLSLVQKNLMGQKMISALKTDGIFMLSNHGVNSELTKEVYSINKEFF